MDFSSLSPRARRAAFAHMDARDEAKPAATKKSTGARTLGSGARHKQLTAANARVQQLDAADQKLASISEQLKSGKITAAEARAQLNAVRQATRRPRRR